MMRRPSKLKSCVALLDIGTSKVCCLVVRFDSNETPEIIGTGFAPSDGIKAGAVTHLDKATACVADVLSQAENQADRRIDKVIVNISSTQLKSQHVYQETDIPDNRQITAADVKRLVDSVIESVALDDVEIIHAFPLGYTVDKEQGIQDPRGLYGRKLGVYMHLVTLPESQSRNLVAVLDRCHVQIDMKVATPYAAALAVLSDEEKEVGATVMDMGAGTTSLALFLGGGLVHLGLIPNGGNAITRDIAQGLSTSLSGAEHLKTLNGAAFVSPRDELDRLFVPGLGDDEGSLQIPRSYLISIIVPRLEEILERCARFLETDSRFLAATRRIVLSGGGSELESVKEKVSKDLNAFVRLGKCSPVKGMPSQFGAHTFSTCIGLLKYAMIKHKNMPGDSMGREPARKGLIGKVIKWLVQNF